MKDFIETGAALILFAAWLAGIALAEGIISTVAAIAFPPWAWYLVVERVLIAQGWLS
jgi:hypothetical protein